MNDYFDLLEAELRAAVPRAVVTPKPRRRRIHAAKGVGPALLGAAVALAVAGIAALLVGHAKRTPRPTPAEPAPASALPTLNQLLDNFVTLRRAQTAADRSWRPPAGSLYGVRYLPGLTRLARNLPHGDRAFLMVVQVRIPQGDQAKGSYAMDLWVVGPGGKLTSSRFGPSAQYTVLPLQFPAPGGPRAVPPPGGLLWTGVVPDGVGAVRWMFVCNRLARSCAGQRAITLTVRVRDNIATTQLPGSGRCGATPADCPHPSTVTWYGTIPRHVVARYKAASVITAPPFVRRKTSPRPARDILSGRGIDGIKLGEPRAAAVAALDRLLGVPGTRPRPYLHACGVDSMATWWDPTSTSGQPSLIVYFGHNRLVGYEYGTRRLHAHGTVLATVRGLTIGDTLERGRRLYGNAFTISTAQGGSWSVDTKSGPIDGYASGVPHPGNLNTVKVKTIDAGNVGCAALSP